LECLERNIAAFRRNRDATDVFLIMRQSVKAQLRSLAENGETFSLIFADPPYGEAAQELLRDQNLPRLLTKDGLIALESAKRETLTIGTPWELVRESVYGDTRISFVRLEMRRADGPG